MLLSAPYVNRNSDSESCGSERASSDLVRLTNGFILPAWIVLAAVLVCTFLGRAHGFNVDVTVPIHCVSLSVCVLLLSGAFIDRVRRAYIAALPPENRVLATVPDERGAVAKRLSRVVHECRAAAKRLSAIVVPALTRCRLDREEMPPASV